MIRGYWTLVAVIFVSVRSFVSPAPQRELTAAPNEKHLFRDQGTDENVRELEELKPGKSDQSVSVVKSHSMVFTNINGQKQQHEDRKEEVEKNGEIIARVSQELDKNSKNQEPHVRTSMDIPLKHFHKVIEHGPKINERLGEHGVNFQLSPENNVKPYPSGSQFSPLDMAEYIFWTGDEKGATSTIEEFLEDGLMTRDEAIVFLEEIKQNLEVLKAQYAADNERPHLQYFSQRVKQQPLTDPLDIRQLIKDSFKRSSSDYVESQAPLLGEDDYEDLIEKLKMSDLMAFNGNSLEEVIYQLANIMFTQSLSRGSVEARDALQKFTDFLETEVQQGRISRSLEKKVLDILIMALSDTLNQHPELVDVARQSLGLLPVPRLYNFKEGSSDSRGVLRPLDDTHRFQGPKTNGLVRSILNIQGNKSA